MSETKSSTPSISAQRQLEARPPKIVNGVNIHKAFSSEEIFELHENGRLRGITLEGYATRVEEGRIYFVPFYESTLYRMEHGTTRQWVSNDFQEAMRQDVEQEHPMTRRTPQERVASMVLRLMATVKNTGGLPGFTDEQIKEIVGEGWRSGMPITEDVVRAIVAKFLNVGEQQNREADSHRAVRQHQFS